MDIFNSREIASIIWIIIAFGIAIISSSVREKILKLIRLASYKGIVFICSLAIIYTGLWILVLYYFEFWNISLLKTTVMWIVLVSLPTIFKSSNTKETKSLFFNTVKDNLNLTIVLEFIIGLYTLPFLVELFLIVPIGFIIGAFIAISDSKNKFYQVKKVLNRCVQLSGLMLIFYGIIQIFYHYKEFTQLTTLKDFLISPLLSFLFLPFIYLLVIYINYETCFAILRNAIKSPSILKYAKRKSFLHFGFNIKALNRWRTRLFLITIESKSDILNSIKSIKELYRIEKSPPVVDYKVGWSPYDAKDFLITEGIKTGYYNHCYDNEWMACSESIKLDKEIIPNNISYYVSGNQLAGKSLKLVLNVNVKNQTAVAHNFLLKYSKSLYQNALKKVMPQSLEKAILNGKTESSKEEMGLVRISKEKWITNKGYNITFEILHY